MSWQDVAGNIISALRHADVKKDVIDLQEKQLGLLTKEIETLTSENAKLKTKVTELESELDRLRPKTDGLDEMKVKFLQLIFSRDVPLQIIARQLGISEGVANYHCDVLIDRDMIEWTRVGIRSAWMGTDQPALLGISQKGRAYLVENKLV